MNIRTASQCQRFLPSAAIVLSTTVMCNVAMAQTSQPTTQASTPDLGPIMKQVAELRELAFKRDVPAELQDAEAFRTMVEEELEAVLPAETRDEIVEGLVRLGMLEEEIDLVASISGAFASQAGAYYDPEAGKFFYLMTDMPQMMLETVAAHELVHALQDQHFGLKDLSDRLDKMMTTTEGPRQDDRLQAIRFLIEGEATYVMNIFQMGAGADSATTFIAQLPLDQLMQMNAQALGGDMAEAAEAITSIPAYIIEPLMAAYLKGARFAMAVRNHAPDDGWESLNRAWNDLPASTEQTLHPEKYTNENRDAPSTFTMLDEQALEDNDWRRIDAAVNGELLLDVMLRRLGATSSLASKATTGWDGDLYEAWKHADGRVAITFRTTWDTEQDATEFFDAYRARLASKYDAGLRIRDERDSSVTFDCGEGLGVGRMIQSGTEVFVAEGFDDAMIASVMELLADAALERVGTVTSDQQTPTGSVPVR